MSTKRGDDRVAAEAVVRLYTDGKILGYRVGRRGGVWLVVARGRFEALGVDASETVLGLFQRNKIPKFNEAWKSQHTVNPMGHPDAGP